MEYHQIKSRIEELSSEEIDENIIGGYYNELEQRVAQGIINKRLRDASKEESQLTNILKKKAVIAAWISAISALISCTILFLTYLKS
jgi:hypothetical protein